MTIASPLRQTYQPPQDAPCGSQNIASLIKTWAEQTPEKTALILDVPGDTPDIVSYGELYQDIRRAAAMWQARLDNPATPRAVALLLPNSLDFAVHYFALLGLGCMVIPLNTRLTWPEIATILEDADAEWLVSTKDFEKTLGQATTDTRAKTLSLLLGQLATQMSLQTAFQQVETWNIQQERHKAIEIPAVAGVFPINVNSQTVATLIYTSGTTGKPKGVMLSHRNILSDAWANIQVVEAVADDVFITISPLFHVFGQTNVLLSAMMAGASVVTVNSHAPKRILECIERHNVTFMAAVPTMYRMFLAVLRDHRYELDSLRVCHSGAAPMGVTLFHEVEAAFGAPVQEGYGLSEASSIVTSNPLHGVRKPGSIGMAIPGVELFVANEEGSPVPAGEVGEVCVSGNTVMLGYRNRPDLTERAFLPAREDWLKTGDMGYQDADGYLFLLDRRDDLINVGGVKVYPREIEEVLYQHEGVAETVVLGKTSEHYTHTVAAFVVLKPGATTSARELKQHCRKRLAPYKVPQTITFMDELPKGATGKLLRNRLRG